MTTAIITVFILILVIGFVSLFRLYNKLEEKYTFTNEYRDRLTSLATKYFESYDSWAKKGAVDSDLYIWLTKNVNRMQNLLGQLGIVNFVAAYQVYHIKNYEIIINTVPKFRLGTVETQDMHYADDCLLRFIGVMEKQLLTSKKKLINPFIWFKQGTQEVLSLPIYIFHWFGIISTTTTGKLTTNVFFRLFAGISALVALISGLVTIIQGKEQTALLIRHLIFK